MPPCCIPARKSIINSPCFQTHPVTSDLIEKERSKRVQPGFASRTAPALTKSLVQHTLRNWFGHRLIKLIAEKASSLLCFQGVFWFTMKESSGNLRPTEASHAKLTSHKHAPSRWPATNELLGWHGSRSGVCEVKRTASLPIGAIERESEMRKG